MSSATTDARAAYVAWLHRRAGLGLHPDEAVAGAASPDPIATLTEPRSDAAAALSDPWDGRTFEADGADRVEAITSWFEHLITSTSPFVDRRTLELHGWLTSSIGAAPPGPMVEQIRLLRRGGGGSFPELLLAVTIDPAMLVYLDGRTSRAGAPNENHARELFELFSLGTGSLTGATSPPYDEDDVQAAATAMTGWVIDRDTRTSRLVPRRHDSTPQSLFGHVDGFGPVDGVSDVGGVIDAVVTHPEHDRFVAARVARVYVDPGTTTDGRPDPEVVTHLAEEYRRNDRRLDPVIEAALRLLGDRPADSPPIVSAPMPWLTGVLRATGTDGRALGRNARDTIVAMGQVPMLPPSVAGWPGGVDWLRTSAVVARTELAAAVATATPAEEPVMVAVDDGDLDRLAVLLGLRDTFTPTTAGAISGARTPAAALALALVSPEYLLT